MARPVIEFLNAVTSTGAQLGSSIQPRSAIQAVQSIPVWIKLRLTTTSGAGSATVTLETSDDNSSWTASVMTMDLSGTLADSKLFCGAVANPFVRANVTAISGTGASVTGVLEFEPPMQV